MPFACAARISARPSPNVHWPRAGLDARRDAMSAAASAAASVSMWPLSASRASECASTPATISPAISARISARAMPSSRRSRTREWSCECTALSLRPRPPEREALGGGRVREEQQVDEPRRREVAEVLSRKVDVRALERRQVVRQVEREAVGDALEAACERGSGAGHDAEEGVRDEQDERELARRCDPRAEQCPQDDDEEHGSGHAAERELRDVVLAAMPELVRDDELQ